MADLEELLRETFRAREQDVQAAPQFRTPYDVTARSSAASRLRWLVPAVATAGLLVAITVVALPDDPTNGPEPSQPTELVGDVEAPPAGMQAVSSLGIEIFAPADWSLNDTGCGQTSAPSVVRGVVMNSGDCFAPEPPDKTVVLIDSLDVSWLPFELTQPYPDGQGSPPPSVPVLTFEPTTVDGRPAERGEALLPDGRAVGVLRFTADDVAVVVRTPNAQLIEPIFASARFVDRDHAGCPTTRPDALSFIAESTADPLAALDTVENATACSYPASRNGQRLGSSAVIHGDELATLKLELRQLELRFDPTPDLSLESCSDPRPVPEEDILLALRLTDATVRYVVLAEWGCETVAIAAAQEGAARLPVDLDHLLRTEVLR